MMDEPPDDLATAAQLGARSDEHVLGPGVDERVDQGLGKLKVDVVHRVGAPLEAVPARVRDVDVDAALVRGVPDAAVAPAELPPRGRLRSPIANRGASGNRTRSRRSTLSSFFIAKSQP